MTNTIKTTLNQKMKSFKSIVTEGILEPRSIKNKKIELPLSYIITKATIAGISDKDILKKILNAVENNAFRDSKEVWKGELKRVKSSSNFKNLLKQMKKSPTLYDDFEIDDIKYVLGD